MIISKYFLKNTADNIRKGEISDRVLQWTAFKKRKAATKDDK